MQNSLKDLDYISMRYNVQKLVSNKKNVYFENKLSESIGKPKAVWKVFEVCRLT